MSNRKKEEPDWYPDREKGGWGWRWRRRCNDGDGHGDGDDDGDDEGHGDGHGGDDYYEGDDDGDGERDSDGDGNHVNDNDDNNGPNEDGNEEDEDKDADDGENEKPVPALKPRVRGIEPGGGGGYNIESFKEFNGPGACLFLSEVKELQPAQASFHDFASFGLHPLMPGLGQRIKVVSHAHDPNLGWSTGLQLHNSSNLNCHASQHGRWVAELRTKTIKANMN